MGYDYQAICSFVARIADLRAQKTEDLYLMLLNIYID